MKTLSTMDWPPIVRHNSPAHGDKPKAMIDDNPDIRPRDRMPVIAPEDWF